MLFQNLSKKTSKEKESFTRCLIEGSFTKYSSCQVPINRRRNNKKGIAIRSKGGSAPSCMDVDG